MASGQVAKSVLNGKNGTLIFSIMHRKFNFTKNDPFYYSQDCISVMNLASLQW